jgi:hypothetical protein
LVLAAPLARAELTAENGAAPSSTSPPAAEESDRATYRRRLHALTTAGPYLDMFGTVMFGDGLRFNNPYRLAHELGKTGESLSTTAAYADLAFAVTTGEPNGLQHGARLSWSFALEGVPQQVITPSYVALLRPDRSWLLYGWAGLPIVAEPDFNVGGELGVGGTWLLRAGLGATSALVLDGFYGAGTRETRAAFYPVVSGQVGLLVSYEVLP